MHFTVYWTSIKVHHRYPDLSDKQTGWLEVHHRFPQIVQDDPTPDAQTPLTTLIYGNLSVIGNRGGRWTLQNRSDFGLSPTSRETAGTTKTNNYLNIVIIFILHQKLHTSQ